MVSPPPELRPHALGWLEDGRDFLGSKDLLNGVGFNGMNKWGDPGNVEVNKLWIIL